MPFGKSVWISRSPLVRGIPLAVLEVHTQWDEEEAGGWGLFFAAGLENMQCLYPNTHCFPGFSQSSLDVLRASTPVHTPLP